MHFDVDVRSLYPPAPLLQATALVTMLNLLFFKQFHSTARVLEDEPYRSVYGRCPDAML